MAAQFDKVLDARLNSMDRALKTLTKLGEDVNAARKGLDDLNVQIDEMGALLNNITGLASELRTGLENITDSMDLFEATRNRNYLVTAARLREQCDNADKLRSILGQLRQNLSVSASTSIRRLRRWKALSSAKVEIDSATAEVLDGHLKQAPNEPDPWRYYLDNVQDPCDDLIADYVDLVSGIALRDHGLHPMSRHADALVSLLLKSFGGEEALALPSRHAPRALIPTRYVRIALPPGWTLWTLPLVARGVGELLRSSKLPGASHAELVPDVFGAFVLGPAYVFAAVLLDFDPRSGLDQLRARTALYVLRRLDKDDDNGRFGRLAGEIEQEWNAATIAASAAATTTNRNGVTAVADNIFEELYNQVALRCGDAAYLAQDKWDKVEQLSTELRSSVNKLSQRSDPRDVLNAMWLARWLHPLDLESVEENATAAAEPVPSISDEHSP